LALGRRKTRYPGEKPEIVEVKVIRSFNGKTPRIADSAFVSEWAYVVGDVEIGENSSVWPGAVIRADFGTIKIGNNTHIEDNCVLHAGTSMEIGDNVMIGHSVVVHCAKIGNNVLVGNNATVLDNVEIGDFCIIGANAVVRQGAKIPSRSFMVGVPAEVKGQVPMERLARREGNSSYAKLAQQYKEQGL